MFKGPTCLMKKISKENPNLPLDTEPRCIEELTSNL